MTQPLRGQGGSPVPPTVVFAGGPEVVKQRSLGPSAGSCWAKLTPGVSGAGWLLPTGCSLRLWSLAGGESLLFVG